MPLRDILPISQGRCLNLPLLRGFHNLVYFLPHVISLYLYANFNTFLQLFIKLPILCN